MPAPGDPCYRDRSGAAHLSLPHRVHLSDGSTRTDASQWFADPAVREATGWSESVLTQADIDRLFPPPPPPPEPSWLKAGWETPMGWRLGWRVDDVALLTALYVMAQRASQLGIDQPCIVTDMAGQQHALTFAEYDQLMLLYGAARAAAGLPPAAPPAPEPEGES
jgi:hypothetical protein